MSRELARATRAQPHWRRPESHALIHASSRIATGRAAPLPGLGAWLIAMTAPMLGGLLPGLVVDPGAAAAVSALAFLGVAAAAQRRRRWRLWREKRPLRRIPPGRPDAAVRGQPLRVVGVARARGRTLSTLSGSPALVIRHLGTRADPGVVDHRTIGLRDHHWEVHAVDFDVVLDDGMTVRVCANGLQLLTDPPARADKGCVYAHVPDAEPRSDWAWIQRQDVIAPGDLVEVGGVLDFEPDLARSVASDRQSRLVPVLGGATGGVYVAPCAPAAAPAIRRLR